MALKDPAEIVWFSTSFMPHQTRRTYSPPPAELKLGCKCSTSGSFLAEDSHVVWSKMAEQQNLELTSHENTQITTNCWTTINFKRGEGASLVVQGLRLCASTAGAMDWSLIGIKVYGKPRSHIPPSAAKNNNNNNNNEIKTYQDA